MVCNYATIAHVPEEVSVRSDAVIVKWLPLEIVTRKVLATVTVPKLVTVTHTTDPVRIAVVLIDPDKPSVSENVPFVAAAPPTTGAALKLPASKPESCKVFPPVPLNDGKLPLVALLGPVATAV